MISSKSQKCQVALLILLLSVVTTIPALAGSAVIGSVAGSMNATIGGQAVLPNTTIVSGDSLQVSDGAAVVAVDDTSRMVFGRQSTASFLRDTNEVTVLLSRGSVSMYHPQDGGALRVKVGDVSVVPRRGFKTLGEIAMVGGSVVISAREGSLRVEGPGSTLELAKGKTITIPTSRAAGPSPGRPVSGFGSSGWEVATFAAAATGAVLGGVAVSKANNARDAANAADVDAKAATAAANASTAAATQADADAKAATAAAAAAQAQATANAATINAVGCAVDRVNPNITVNGVKVSPYTPPAGVTCP